MRGVLLFLDKDAVVCSAHCFYQSHSRGIQKHTPSSIHKADGRSLALSRKQNAGRFSRPAVSQNIPPQNPQDDGSSFSPSLRETL